MIQTQTEPGAAAQMVAAAHEQINDLEGKLQEIARLMSEAQSELAAIAQAREARTHTLSMGQSEHERLEGEYTQAVSYAKLAHKTPNERRAIKATSDAKKAVQSAKGKLDRLEREAIEAEQLASTREQELSRQVHLLQVEQEARESEKEAVMRGRTQASKELGQERYAAVVQGYEERQRQIDQAASQLVDLQVSLHDYYQEALHELSDWPDLRKEVEQLMPQSDSTSRILEMTMHYIDTYLHDVRHIRTDFPRPSVRSGYTVWDYLTIPSQELQMFHAQLRERRDSLERLLTDYRAFLANETL